MAYFNYCEGLEAAPGYRLVHTLGRGYFGQVWKATGPGNVDVALKIIQGFGRGSGGKDLRSLQLLKGIRHPNIVPVFSIWLKSDDGSFLSDVSEFSPEDLHNVFRQDRLAYPRTSYDSPMELSLPTELLIAMGLADMSLSDRLSQCLRAGQRGISLEELLTYIEDAARALDFLSKRHNIQHGDIKPQNILILGDAAQVCDIGLARTLNDLSGTSLAFAAPEAFMQREPRSFSDQYSLAISYYELRTGLLPFHNTNAREVLYKKESGDLDLALVSDAERQVLTRAVNPEPTCRYPDVVTMVQQLRAAACGTQTASSAPAMMAKGAFNINVPDHVLDAFSAAPPSRATVSGLLPVADPPKQAPASTPDEQPLELRPSVADSSIDFPKPPEEAPPPETKACASTAHVSRPVRPRSPDDEAFSSQAVVLRYPAPIAIAYRRFCGRGQPRDRLAQLFDTFEITLKYLVYLGLSDLCHCRLQSEGSIAPFPNHQGFDLLRRPTHMTLGRWVRSVVDIADTLEKEPNRFVKELPAACGSKSLLNREIFDWINHNRNLVTHRRGGIALNSEQSVQLLREARPRLERLLQQLAFLRHYPLGFVTAGYPGRANRVRYRVHSCMGARIASGEEVYSMQTDTRLPVDAPFVVAPDETRILSLWPFLLERESDTTQRPSLYVFEEISPDRKFLTSVQAAAIDHEDLWVKELHPEDADDHEWLWEALRKLPQTVAVTPALSLAEGLAESVAGRLTGESLGDEKQYRLVGLIARGGFGTVYDAVDVRTDGRVAIKVLEGHEGLDARDSLAQLRRFEQEYEKLQQAQEFPGVIRCFEWGIDILRRREYPWFSMEFAEGGDLNGRLVERRANLRSGIVWDQPELRQIVTEEFRAIVEAVAHLHDLNIIHRDIKPANVLILDEGKLRLSDFGLVKELDRPRTGNSIGPGSSRGAVLGTRDYMAPEQERGDQATMASDVYSLGIVLAELVTGHRPQATPNVAAGSPIDRDAHLDRLPDKLRRLIIEWTDIEAGQRPANARYCLHKFDQVVRAAQ